VAGGLPDLRQVIAAADLTPDAFPAVVAGAGRKRGQALDTMLRTVRGLYRRLETLCGAIGLASVIRPVGALLTANVRDPQRFGDAALRLDQAHASAGRLHAGVADGLGVLAADWTGQAHDAHRDATLNTYQPHLATLQDHAQNLAEKDWQSQYAQRRFHDRVVIILGWALMALAAFLTMLALDVLFDGAILYGTVMLLAAVVVAIKGAVMALYTDWPS
jgi:hypothetical protein